jgi:hypothetical protein
LAGVCTAEEEVHLLLPEAEVVPDGARGREVELLGLLLNHLLELPGIRFIKLLLDQKNLEQFFILELWEKN